MNKCKLRLCYNWWSILKCRYFANTIFHNLHHKNNQEVVAGNTAISRKFMLSWTYRRDYCTYGVWSLYCSMFAKHATRTIYWSGTKAGKNLIMKNLCSIEDINTKCDAGYLRLQFSCVFLNKFLLIFFLAFIAFAWLEDLNIIHCFWLGDDNSFFCFLHYNSLIIDIFLVRRDHVPFECNIWIKIFFFLKKRKNFFIIFITYFDVVQ